ncbi:hypothetical protein HI914_07350 [Erysiphe necator]|nr:hypothetical protein HI914_07350 [Erysiphe necator]
MAKIFLTISADVLNNGLINLLVVDTTIEGARFEDVFGKLLSMIFEVGLVISIGKLIGIDVDDSFDSVLISSSNMDSLLGSEAR